jgi:DNA-binding HxlR family transcriptional regulator
MNTEASPKIPNVITDFTNQVDRTFRGLGRPVLYNTLSIIANKSVFDIGDRGTGKTRVIRLTPSPQGSLAKKWNSFTYEELSDFCYDNQTEGFKGVLGRNIVFKVEELSSLQEYHRELLLTVISTIITDKGYKHQTKWSPFLNFESCHLTCLIAIQPILYSRLCNSYEQWESMSYDRFTKFLLLNPLRNSDIDFDNLTLTLPPIKPIQTISLPEKLDVKKVNNLFKEQLSQGRSMLFTNDYLKAYASFKGQSEVTEADVEEFHYLFKPYLHCFNILQKADYEYKVTVNSGNLKVLTAIANFGLKPVPKKELTQMLKCSDKMIEITTNNLLEHHLITKTEEENSQGKPVSYELSEELKTYFKEYNKGIQ